MDILDISHIQHYPIGGENALKFLYTKTEKYANREVGIAVGIGNVASPYIDLKIGKDIHRLCLNSLNHSVFPLLYPPSCLYSAMEDGSVPIAYIASIICGINKEWTLLETSLQYEGDKCNYHFFYEDGSFHYVKSFEDGSFRNIRVENQLQAFQYCYSKHIDLEGLIPKGLAIDITTLNNQTK